jgi:hypothetical protein
MSKEQTPIEHTPSKECERIEKLINHFLSASGVSVELHSMCRKGIDDLINAKVLEALEKYRVYAWKKGLTISDLETFTETEVKPKYK